MTGQGKTFIRRRGTTAVPNSTVHDSRISLQALGILVVVLGRPASRAGNGYRAFLGRGLGQVAITNALKELEAAGYRYRFTRRAAGGKVVTDVVWSETPIDAATAAAWHADEVEGFETRNKPAKVRKLKAGTVRGNLSTDRAEDSKRGTVLSSPSLVSSAPSLRDVQGSPTRYARNGEPEFSNARATEAEHAEAPVPTAGPELAEAPTAGPGPAEAPTAVESPTASAEGQEGATAPVRGSVPPLAPERGQDGPGEPGGPERAGDGRTAPQGVEAWHAVKARLAAQREERRAREAAEARFGRLTEPTDHHHPRPRTGVRA